METRILGTRSKSGEVNLGYKIGCSKSYWTPGLCYLQKKIHMGRAEYENNGYSRPSDSILARAPKNI